MQSPVTRMIIAAWLNPDHADCTHIKMLNGFFGHDSFEVELIILAG